MFDKLKFNNLVISNKKGIQQSRTQTINKLVHKIRKLKTLFEKHPDNIKCKERIRKSTETMEILKKLKSVDIMKKLLLMDKPAVAIITNGISIPEEMAIALLSMNKVMQNLIKKFKTELKINELESDDWRQVLLESSKRKRKIERTEEKRRKRLELKQQKAVGRKRQEWLEENQIETELISFKADESIPAVGDWEIEELRNKTVEDNEAANDSNKELKIKKKEIPVTKRNLVANKKQKFVKLEQINGNDDLELPNSNIKEMKNDDTLVVDPFFVTATGENYLSTAISNVDIVSEGEINKKRERQMIKLNKFGQKPLALDDNRNQNRQYKNKWENQDVQSKKHVNRNGKFSRTQSTDKNNGQIKHQNSYKKDFTINNNEKILHPSWAAKQKLKPIITEFKGKKLTFDDDLNTTSAYPGKDMKSKKSAAIKSNNCEKDSLHPSWVAKQKLKPCITAFQGKKITFDNDD